MLNFELKYLPIYFTLFAGISSHLLLIICLVKDPLKSFRNSATYLITNLAFSDFISCVFGSIEILDFSEEMRNVVSYISKTAMFASLLSIFSIAIDRYILTVHPFKHRVLLNGRRIAIWIVSIWLLSLCLLVKYLAFDMNQMDNKIYDATFIIIAVVTSLMYVLIYFSLRKKQQDISEQNRSGNRALQEAFVKTIMIVAFIQIFTLVPSSVYCLINGWGNEFSVVNLIFFEIYFVNFAINPFLYIWRLKNYRETFRLIFCRKLR